MCVFPKGACKKKLAFLAEASAKVLAPDPQLLADNFFLYMDKFKRFWIKKGLKWMNLKERKNIDCKGTIPRKNSIFY